MWATVVPKLVTPGLVVPTAGSKGKYVRRQDPDSGEVLTVWEEEASPTATTPSAEYDIRCYARAYTALGYRSSANRESWVQQDYSAIESIQFDYPKGVVLNRQTLITKLRSHQNYAADFAGWLWPNEDTGQPIVWEVQGVSPVHDPFGKHIRNTTVLKRSEVQ